MCQTHENCLPGTTVYKDLRSNNSWYTRQKSRAGHIERQRVAAHGKAWRRQRADPELSDVDGETQRRRGEAIWIIHDHEWISSDGNGAGGNGRRQLTYADKCRGHIV